MFESTVVCGRIALGIQGEHNARKVAFYDAKIWQEIFGEGRFELLHQRNGDEAPYPVVVTIEDDVPYWYVSSSDTAVAGSGKCELRYMVDDKLIKSCTYITDVVASLGDDTTEAPEPEKAWVDQVLEAGDTAKQAVELSEKAIEASEVAEQSAKDAEAFAKEAENFASESGGHISDESNPHNVTAEQVGAYNKTEVDNKLKNPSYEEQVKLTGITTAIPGHEDAMVEITDNSVSSDWCTFDIDIHGEVRFTCECTESRVGIVIDGMVMAEIGVDTDGGETKYTFEGVIKNGMTVHCSMAMAKFTEFIKKVYVTDAIGDINGKIGDIESVLGAVATSKADKNDVYTKGEVDNKFVYWHGQLFHKIYHDEIDSRVCLATDVLYLYNAENVQIGKTYDKVPFSTATIFNKQPYSASLGLPTIIQTAIADDGLVYVREIRTKDGFEDEYDFSVPWECKTYTKEEVDVILQNYAKKQQSFDGIIRLEYNDGIIDTYELDNTTTAGTYRVVIDSTNDIIGNTDKEQYILLVGISSYGEEILYTQTRISNNGMMETRSRSNFDEEWSEWHNKMLGDIDRALDELHGYAQALIGGEA